MNELNWAARDLKNALTMSEVAERYGMAPNRAGFAHCPFHAGDRDASLKIYPGGRGWHCFGCGEGGDIISFVQKLFNLDFMGALHKLNDDFGLNLPGLAANSPSNKAVVDKAIRDRRLKIAAKKAEESRLRGNWLRALMRWINADRIIKALRPVSIDDVPAPEWTLALKKREYASYALDEAEEELRRFERTDDTEIHQG